MTLAEYVRVVANTLGLPHWNISIENDDSLQEGTFARVYVAHARAEALISFAPSFHASSPEERRATIVHELLHCILWPLEEYIEDSIPQLIGKPAYTVFESGFNLLTERAIDPLSVAIADMGSIPLPPEDNR